MIHLTKHKHSSKMTREDADNAVPTDHMLSENQDEPKDKFYMTYILFYFLGTTSMLPVSFYTTATDYWMYKFRDIDNGTTSERTKLQTEFVADYSIVSHVSNIVFFIFTLVVLKRFSIVKRIIGTLCGALLMFAITCVFVLIDTDGWQIGFFIVSLVIGFFLTGFCAMLQVTIFDLAATFPAGYVTAIPAGVSVSGIFSALLQIFSLSIGASSKTTGISYFAAGLFFVFETMILFVAALRYSKFFRYHLSKEGQQNRKTNFISTMIVLSSIVMIHAGVTSLVVSVDKGNGNKWNDTYFVPVITFLVYNIADYMGRESAKLVNRPTYGLIIFIASCCRASLVPLIMLCNAQPRSRMPVVFDKDYCYVIFMIVFGFSGGYLVNLSILQIHRETTPGEKKLSMLLLLTSIFTSMSIFSFLGPVMVKAL